MAHSKYGNRKVVVDGESFDSMNRLRGPKTGLPHQPTFCMKGFDQ